MKTPDEMLEAYIECALWSSVSFSGEEDDNGTPFDEIDAELSEECHNQFDEDCANFLAYCEETGTTHDDWDFSQLGHDFWLTRNGHGAGFWDRHSQTSCEAYEREQKIAIISRDFSKRNALDDTCPCAYHQGQRLTKAAKTFGSCDLYLGDDGLIYCQ